jgi:hypothetical protein
MPRITEPDAPQYRDVITYDDLITADAACVEAMLADLDPETP